MSSEVLSVSVELEKAAVKTESQVTFHIDFGQELYAKVFAGELVIFFQKRLQANGEGLRISLQFDDDAQKLATLPWEFLHDGEDFLVARRNTLNLTYALQDEKGSVCAPGVGAAHAGHSLCPSGQELCFPGHREGADRILQAVDRLYVQRKMEVDFTDDATFETIQSYLNEKDYQIVHFTGHGTEVEGQGFLVLENEDLTARQVNNQAIADLFR